LLLQTNLFCDEKKHQLFNNNTKNINIPFPFIHAKVLPKSLSWFGGMYLFDNLKKYIILVVFETVPIRSSTPSTLFSNIVSIHLLNIKKQPISINIAMFNIINFFRSHLKLNININIITMISI
jgi:hypothetical protein